MRCRAATPEEREEIARRVDVHLTPDARGIVAVTEAGEVRAGIAYDGWTVSAVFAHFYCDSPVALRTLRKAAFAYPFEEGGRQVLLATIRQSNRRSVRVVRDFFGLREVARVRDGFAPGDDLLMFEMRREWLAPKRKAA